MEIDNITTIRSCPATDEENIGTISVKNDRIDVTVATEIYAVLRKALEQRGITAPCISLKSRKSGVVIIELFSVPKDNINKTMVLLMEHLQDYGSTGVSLEDYLDRISRGYRTLENNGVTKLYPDMKSHRRRVAFG